MKPSAWQLVLAGVLAMVLLGCGGNRTSESAGPSLVVDPATAGSITGVAMLDRPAPPLPPIDMSASPACGKANPSPVIPPVVVTGERGALANVVVYVKAGLASYRFEPPVEPVTLGQKNCMYEPHVLALMTQQTLEIQNNDPTLHNVHPMPKENRQWSTSQLPGSAALRSSFVRPEFAMPVLCNIHPWMRAFVFVFDHPYFAVTSKTGMFELKNLPPGTYTIAAWHERYSCPDQTLTVSPKESRTVSFTFR